MKRTFTLGLVAASIALVGGLAWAGARLEDRHADRARQFVTWKLEDALDDIDATDTQRQTAMSLKDQLFDEGLKVRATHQRVREELVAQWKADRMDAPKVHALVDELLDGVRAFAHEAADAAITLHDTLTPEQRQKVLDRAQEHRGRWHR